jgi:hypothetical protein
VTLEEIRDQLVMTRGQLKWAGEAYTNADGISRILVTIEYLIAAVEALAAHVASQATDGK